MAARAPVQPNEDTTASETTQQTETDRKTVFDVRYYSEDLSGEAQLVICRYEYRTHRLRSHVTLWVAQYKRMKISHHRTLNRFAALIAFIRPVSRSGQFACRYRSRQSTTTSGDCWR